jgi:hypothetical protein
VARSVIVVLAFLLFAPAAGAVEQELLQAILAQVKSKPVTCPEELPETLLCGDFHGEFSTFKFELEFELGMQDFQAEPLTPWKLLGGIYARTYRLGEDVVSIGFERKRRLVILKPGALPEEPAAPESDDEKGDGPPPDGEDHEPPASARDGSGGAR